MKLRIYVYQKYRSVTHNEKTISEKNNNEMKKYQIKQTYTFIKLTLVFPWYSVKRPTFSR